jgi:hypothetical protein
MDRLVSIFKFEECNIIKKMTIIIGNPPTLDPSDYFKITDVKSEINFEIFINVTDIASLIGHHIYRSQEHTIENLTQKITQNLTKDLTKYPFQSDILEFCQLIYTISPKYEQLLLDRVSQLPNNLDFAVYFDNIMKQSWNNKALQKKIRDLFPNLCEIPEDYEIIPEEKISSDDYVYVQPNYIKLNNCKKGVYQEPKAISIFEKLFKVSIIDKQRAIYYKFGYINIKGKIDGLLKSQRIVMEVKTRIKNFPQKIPVYDIIQLVTYMNLIDINNPYDGYLVEYSIRSNTLRVTHYKASDCAKLWSDILLLVNCACKKINNSVLDVFNIQFT